MAGRLCKADGTSCVSLPIAAGNIDGAGSANKVARFTDADTLGAGVITDNGSNVGIGTTSPSELLDVGGNIKVSNATSFVDTPEIRLGSASYRRIGYVASSGPYLGYNLVYNGGFKHNSLGASSGIAFLNNGDTQFFAEGAAVAGASAVEAMRIASSGNVGIGTTSPNEKLEVNGNAALNSFALGDGYGLFFRPGFTLNMGITARDWSSSNASSDGLLISAYDGIGFMTASNSYDSTKMRMMITNTGNVGIGTNSPAYKLDVR